MVALSLGGAARGTSARNVGEKYMKPPPCAAQNRNGQIHGTLSDPYARIAATRIRLAPPQANAPMPIFFSSEGAPPPPRPCQLHSRNSNGTHRMLNSGSIDWNHGIGTWKPPALMSACCSS